MQRRERMKATRMQRRGGRAERRGLNMVTSMSALQRTQYDPNVAK